MVGKLLLKGLTMAVADPEGTAKVFLGVVVVAVLPIFFVVSPFVLFLSRPLVRPVVLQLYAEGVGRTIQSTADSYYGPVPIEWEAVLAIDTVLFEQDFSHLEMAVTHEPYRMYYDPEIREEELQKIAQRARRFIEHVGTAQVERKVGYENIYNEDGEVVGERPVYKLVSVPVLQLKSLEKVLEILEFTPYQVQWAQVLLESLR